MYIYTHILFLSYVDPDRSRDIERTWELWIRDESDFDICPFGILRKMIFTSTGS